MYYRKELKVKTRLFCSSMALMLLAIGCKTKPNGPKATHKIAIPATLPQKKLTKTSLTLHQAAREGNVKLAQLLIENGANVNAKDEFDDTPLHIAAGYGHKNVVEMLLAHNAEIDAMNNLAETPLHVAASHGCIDVAGHLIDSGAEINAADINAKKLGRGMPLYCAIFFGDMDNGADVNVRNEGELGKTPLHEAISSWCKPLVQFLIDNGANLNCKDDSGETPLALSMSLENKEIAKLLATEGADTTVHQAAYVGDLEKVRSFL